MKTPRVPSAAAEIAEECRRTVAVPAARRRPRPSRARRRRPAGRRRCPCSPRPRRDRRARSRRPSGSRPSRPGRSRVTDGAGGAGPVTDARRAARNPIVTVESAAAPLKSCRSVRDVGPRAPPPRSTPSDPLVLAPCSSARRTAGRTGRRRPSRSAVPNGRIRPVVTEKTTRADGDRRDAEGVEDRRRLGVVAGRPVVRERSRRGRPPRRRRSRPSPSPPRRRGGRR